MRAPLMSAVSMLAYARAPAIAQKRGAGIGREGEMKAGREGAKEGERERGRERERERERDFEHICRERREARSHSGGVTSLNMEGEETIQERG